jgi:hypothetical protein
MMTIDPPESRHAETGRHRGEYDGRELRGPRATPYSWAMKATPTVWPIAAPMR